MGNNGLEKLLVTGKVEGQRAREWQSVKYLDSLATCWSTNIAPLELIKVVIIVDAVMDDSARSGKRTSYSQTQMM